MNFREAKDKANVINNHFYCREDKFRLNELMGLEKICTYVLISISVEEGNLCCSLSDESNYFDVSKSGVTSPYHSSTHDITFLSFDKFIFDN